MRFWAFLCIDIGSMQNVPDETKLGFEQANALQVHKLIWFHPRGSTARMKFSKNWQAPLAEHRWRVHGA
jgi:hypothetical protein